MKIQITGKNIDLTEAIKDYVNEKIGSLEKFYNKIIEVRVELEKIGNGNDKNNFRVLVNFQVPGGLLRVDQTEDDLYAAIDVGKEEMEQQLRKHKEKFITKNKKANKTKRLLKTIFFWRDQEQSKVSDMGEQEENEE